jgi:hypothetical protein
VPSGKSFKIVKDIVIAGRSSSSNSLVGANNNNTSVEQSSL